MVARRTWTDDSLRMAVARCRSMAGLLNELGLVPEGGGTYKHIRAHIDRLGLDTAHFRGQGWAKGMTVDPSPLQIPLEGILVAGRKTNSAQLRMRLIQEGLKDARCEWCGIDSWRGEPAPLELDHINGINSDNRIENLRVLCPNCHAQTPTYCGKNIRR